MTVSMDGLRWQLLSAYNNLTRKLNGGIEGEEVRVYVDDIDRDLDQIRSCIVTLAYMYDEREDGFDILKEPTFEIFNEEIE